MDLHKLPEAAAVVVPNGLRIPKSLQQGVGCTNQMARLVTNEFVAHKEEILLTFHNPLVDILTRPV